MQPDPATGDGDAPARPAILLVPTLVQDLDDWEL